MEAWALIQKSVMMLAVEYVTVRTRRMMLQILGGTRWRQDVVAVLLGTTPGCRGAYALAARVGSSNNPPAKPGAFR